MTFEKLTVSSPAYDRRDPDPKKNYGIHGLEIHWILRGNRGAIYFALATGWDLPHVRAEGMSVRKEYPFEYWRKPATAGIGYHSPVPQYEKQPAREKCDYLGGALCYSDCSYLAADAVFETLIREGLDGLWRELEDWYWERFGIPSDCACTTGCDGINGSGEAPIVCTMCAAKKRREDPREQQ